MQMIPQQSRPSLGPPAPIVFLNHSWHHYLHSHSKSQLTKSKKSRRADGLEISNKSADASLNPDARLIGPRLEPLKLSGLGRGLK